MNEAELRREMVRVCRAMSERGLSPGTSGNLSVRVPGGMLITPSAIPYDRLEPEQMVWMRLDGSAAPGDVRPSTEWRMHADLLRARADVGAVFHAHPMFCTTLACLHRDIPAFHYMVAVAGGDSIRCAPYATFGSAELAAHALAALDGRRACLLANHGMVALGASPAAALDLAVEVETLAAQYWRALQVAEPRRLTDAQMEEVLARFRDYRPADAPVPVDPRADAPAAARDRAPALGRVAAAARARPRRSAVDWADVGQRWVGRIGALLLLLGLAYLMKFAADQGWLGPPLRVAFGVATGAALLLAGLRLEAGKRLYGLTLLGTGVATLYLTGYAAYALYGYLGPRTAFVALAATTALALVLARRRAEQVLAQVGAAGAFATPLLLGEAGGAVALSLYVVGVSAWTGALAFLHGWRALFVTILVGTFGLLALGVDEARSGGAIAVSAAGAWAFAVAALLPLARERLWARAHARRRPVPSLLRHAVHAPEGVDHLVVATLIPAAAIPLVGLQAALWELGRGGAAWVGFAAIAAAGALLAGPGQPGPERARHVGAAPLLGLWIGVALLVPGDGLRVGLLAAAGLAAFLAPPIRRAAATAVVGHSAFAVLAAWITAQLSLTGRAPGFATPLALAELAAIIAAALVGTKALEGPGRRAYLLGAHLAALAWVAVSARGVDGGLAWVSVLWGLYGAALMVLAVTRNLPAVRLVALATLGLVAGKLLLIDTAGVDAAWRIVLFLGAGAAFLALGYLSTPDPRRTPTAGPAPSPPDRVT